MEKLPDKKLSVRLIALDLDDTLLNDDKNISDRNVIALRRCVERGIYVVLCSGRLEEGILPFVRRLNIAGTKAGRFLIAINGCSIFDLHQRVRIYCNQVPADVLLRADEMAEAAGLHSEVYTPDTIYYGMETEWTRKDVELCHVTGRIAPNYREFLKKEFPKMLIAGEPERLRPLLKQMRAEFGRRAVVFTSKPYFLEILPPDCGKGEAIAWLAAHIGIPMEETMCFGDAMNDESMIRTCGAGVAMKNGTDEIKALARFVTEGTNNESGVGAFIEKYVL